jgi:hypothetical protein
MIDALQDSLPRLAEANSPMRVATTTLLPSGALVTVMVQPAANGAFQVTDDGAARKDLLALGHHELSRGDVRNGNTTAERLGLIFDGKGFSLRDVTADQLAGAIVFVAEGAREWANTAAVNAARRAEAALAQRVESRIRATLPNASIDRERELAGASTKKHRFDLVLNLPGERKAVFEVVNPNPNSLSAAHLKLFDLMGAHPDWPREAVTERLSDWAPADMMLLAAVATHVRGMEQDWRDLGSLVN